MASISDNEVSGINQHILDCLLEETQVEEQDDERLNTVIRSLEAEINPDLMAEYHNLLAQVELVGELEIDSSADGTGGMDMDMDFSWVDLDTAASSSPSDDMNWYMNQYVENTQEAEGLWMMGEYSQLYYAGGFPVEQSYRPSWQENCDEMM